MNKVVRVLGVLFFALFLFSCAGGPAATTSDDIYMGAGSDASPGTARRIAVMDAVKKCVIDIIGQAQADGYAEQLQVLVYSSLNYNKFIYKDTVEVLRRDMQGEKHYYELKVKVRRDVIEDTLKANYIMPGGAEEATPDAVSAVVETYDPTPVPTPVPEDTPEPVIEATTDDWGEVSEEEKRLIRRYVDTMTYMVSFPEDSEVDEFLQKAAIASANSFLASKSVEAIDAETIEQLKKEQSLVYEEEAGEEMSFIQWIAQKLNADIYIEIDAELTGEEKSASYYGFANILLKIYEASTGRLLGSQPMMSANKSFSRVSALDALSNAVSAVVFKAMPFAYEQAQNYMQKALVRGLKYEVIVLNTPDSRAVSSFRRKIKNSVKEINQISSSAEETRFEVYLIGKITDLEDLIYDVSEAVDGFEGIYMIYMRGNSITFDTGM